MFKKGITRKRRDPTRSNQKRLETVEERKETDRTVSEQQRVLDCVKTSHSESIKHLTVGYQKKKEDHNRVLMEFCNTSKTVIIVSLLHRQGHFPRSSLLQLELVNRSITDGRKRYYFTDKKENIYYYQNSLYEPSIRLRHKEGFEVV